MRAKMLRFWASIPQVDVPGRGKIGGDVRDFHAFGVIFTHLRLGIWSSRDHSAYANTTWPSTIRTLEIRVCDPERRR